METPVVELSFIVKVSHFKQGEMNLKTDPFWLRLSEFNIYKNSNKAVLFSIIRWK